MEAKKRFFECKSCNQISSAEFWNESTLMEILDDYADEEEYSMTDIEDAMEHMDGSTWFNCPQCYEHVYNDALHLREVPLEKTPYAHLIYKTNERAKELLEESW